MQTLYRYTSNGEGIFSAGKRLLPEELVKEAFEARKWLPKPILEQSGNYRFYLTLKGKEQYDKTLLPVHKKYLKDIELQEISFETIKSDGRTIVYEDEWQVVIRE